MQPSSPHWVLICPVQGTPMWSAQVQNWHINTNPLLSRSWPCESTLAWKEWKWLKRMGRKWKRKKYENNTSYFHVVPWYPLCLFSPVPALHGRWGALSIFISYLRKLRSASKATLHRASQGRGQTPWPRFSTGHEQIDGLQCEIPGGLRCPCFL